MPDTTTRPLRLCESCGGLDDHPRHVIDGVANGAVSQEFLASLPDGIPASALALALTGNVTIRHIDCCAAQGCAVCAATEQVTAGKRGQKLVDTIANGALDGFEPPEVTSNAHLGLTEEDNTDG